jgi:hypothetical protein
MSKETVEAIKDLSGTAINSATSMAEALTSKALEATKTLIDAATPIAKQAYEIGLTVIRIDALSTLLFSIVLGASAAWGLIKIIGIFREAMRLAKEYNDGPDRAYRSRRRADDYLTGLGVGEGFVGLVMLIVVIGASTQLLNIWLWVKLFSPELWLARQAVSKVLGI